MKKLNLEEVKKALVRAQVDYLTTEEGYDTYEAEFEAFETADELLSRIESIEVEDNQDITIHTDYWCNTYHVIKGNYIVTTKSGKKFANYNNEITSLFEVVELTSPDTVEL